MIVDVVGIPQVSLLDARLLCETAGVKLGYLRQKAPTFQSFRPRIQSYFGPLRVVYIDDLAIFNQYAESLLNKKQHHIILINVAYSILIEVGLRIHGEGRKPLLTSDLVSMFEARPLTKIPERLSSQQNLAEEIMKGINKESLLGKLQTSFYRIKQVDDRQRMAALVYAYLSGSIKRRPMLNIPYLDKLLQTELCDRFVKAISDAKQTGPDAAAERHGIDRFEIAYILKRSGYEFDNNT